MFSFSSGGFHHFVICQRTIQHQKSDIIKITIIFRKSTSDQVLFRSHTPPLQFWMWVMELWKCAPHCFLFVSHPNDSYVYTSWHTSFFSSQGMQDANLDKYILLAIFDFHLLQPFYQIDVVVRMFGHLHKQLILTDNPKDHHQALLVENSSAIMQQTECKFTSYQFTNFLHLTLIHLSLEWKHQQSNLTYAI